MDVRLPLKECEHIIDDERAARETPSIALLRFGWGVSGAKPVRDDHSGRGAQSLVGSSLTINHGSQV